MTSAVLIRLTAFLSVLTVMALWEVWAPRRRLTTGKGRRWAANLSIIALDAAIIRFLFAAGAVGDTADGVGVAERGPHRFPRLCAPDAQLLVVQRVCIAGSVVYVTGRPAPPP